MKVFPRMSRAAIVAAAVIAGALSAHAQDPYLPPAPDSGWKSELTFYLWASNLDGKIRNAGLEAEVSADYWDFLEKIESTFAVRFETWRQDTIGFAFDASWLTMEDDPDIGTGSGDLELTWGFTEATVSWRTRAGNAYLDAIAGVRWIRYESELTNAADQSEDHDKNYFDPLIGVGVGFKATGWLDISMRFDIGGFGIGTERTGNLVILLDFRVAESMSVNAGWRSMAIEIDEDRDEVNLFLGGPVFGFSVGF